MVCKYPRLQGLCIFECDFKFVRPLALFGDSLFDLGFFVIQVAQIFQSVCKFTQSLVIACAMHLFTIAGDERYCAAFIKKVDDIL